MLQLPYLALLFHNKSAFMKIVFDIMHPAHINFFQNAIFTLNGKGHEIVLTVLDRGKVPLIVRKEFPGIRTQIIGRHKGSIFSIIFQANIFRFITMLKFLLKERPDVGLSVGSFIMGFGMKLINRKNYQFDDDPERKMNVFLEKFSSTQLFFPFIYKDNSSKVKNFDCLKEWAYLSPAYFKPNINSLIAYGLKPKEYIFIREISNNSLNYKDQRGNIIARFSQDLPKNFKYLLSLEDKKTLLMYPKDWILIKEPVNDIHSLIYYSSCTISSGDSMAREASMLGVPSIYCGIRNMRANELMMDKGILLCTSKNIPSTVDQLLLNSEISNQETFRQKLLTEWTDVNKLILDLVFPSN
jgi:uncharacterized protein